MREPSRISKACAFLLFIFASQATWADGLSDAKAGLAALNKSNFGDAVALFSKAIASGTLSPADRELAYLKRAEAYMGQKHNDLALVDLDMALKLDPNDKDVKSLRAQILSSSAPGPAPQSSGSGLTIEETFKFIATKAMQQGPVTSSWYDKEDHSTFTAVIIFRNFRLDANACKILFHRSMRMGGEGSTLPASEDELIISYKSVAGFSIDSSDKSKVSGSPVKIHYSVELTSSDGSRLGGIQFSDSDTATRVGKAFVHASTLCRPGAEPF